MTFGERLYQLRKEKNLSQEELAEQLDVSRQSVSRWENGTASPDFDKTVRLSEIFGVTTDYLIKGEEQVPIPAPPKEPPKELPVWRKILSVVLLVLGGLTLIYGILGGGYLEYYLLFPVPLTAGGLICLFSKKYTLLKFILTLYYCATNFLYVSFSWHYTNAFWSFREIIPQYKRFILPGWILLITLIAMILYSAWTLRKLPIHNPKTHLLITLLFPVVYLVQEFVYYLFSQFVLTLHFSLVHGVSFQLINILFYTLRMLLIVGFAVYLARWIHYKRT